MAGYGEGATETQRADAQIANQVRLLRSEHDQIKALLDEHRTVTDPLTGEEIATPHKRINGEQRAGYEARLAEIGHQYGRLVGPEGEKLRADALAKDKANYRAMEEQLAVMKEADVRAVEMAREAKIDQLAQAKLRFRQSSLG